MRSVENGLLYDTDDAEYIGNYYTLFEDYTFYRTKKGRIFCVYSTIIDSISKSGMFLTNPEHVRDLMFQYLPGQAHLIYGDIKKA